MESKIAERLKENFYRMKEETMNIKKRKKLGKMLLFMSLGSLMTPPVLGATAYTETLTGDLATDLAQGYSVTESETGQLVYDFLPSDKIQFVGDHSIWDPNTWIYEEYNGIKVNSTNTNKLDLTKLKNIELNVVGPTGTLAANDSFGLDTQGVGIADSGSAELSMGNNTQIALIQASGNLVIGESGNLSLLANFTGVSQSNATGSERDQIFGNQTQIVLGQTVGEVSTGSYVSMSASFKGSDQNSSMNSKSSQAFGDTTRIKMSHVADILHSGASGSIGFDSNFTGVSQEITSGGEGIQIFGDSSQIALSQTAEEMSSHGNLSLSSSFFGVSQNSIDGSGSQAFGNETQLFLSQTAGEMIADEGGNINLNAEFLGLSQTSGSLSLSLNRIKSSQLFGDNTYINLTQTFGDFIGENNGRINLESAFSGIVQNSMINGEGSQIFGENTQIVLTKASGNLLFGEAGSGTLKSNFTGIQQSSRTGGTIGIVTTDTSSSSTQTFGDNTKIALVQTSRNMIAGDYSYLDSPVTFVGIEQTSSIGGGINNTSIDDRSSSTQTFGDKNLIFLSNTLGDITRASTTNQLTLNLNSEFTGITQNSSLGGGINNTISGSSSHSMQTFGDETRVILDQNAKEMIGGNGSWLNVTTTFSGILQTNMVDSGSGGQITDGTSRGEQTFGDRAEILLTQNLEKMAIGDGGNISRNSNFAGIGQSRGGDGATGSQKFGKNSSVGLIQELGDVVTGNDSGVNLSSSLSGIYQFSDTATLQGSQTFGDHTQVWLSQSEGITNIGDDSHLFRSSTLIGVYQSGLEVSQIFGENTQISLTQTSGDLTAGERGYRSLQTDLVGVRQETTNGAQVFGDNTDISLIHASGKIMTEDGGSLEIRSSLTGIGQSGGNGDGNSQIFGDNTHIFLTDSNENILLGDQSSGGINSALAGIQQINYMNHVSQVFGDNTQIEVNSSFGGIQNGETILVTNQAMGIEQRNYGASAQMNFGTGTQIKVHAEVGNVRNVTNLDGFSHVNAYGIYSEGTSADDLVFLGDLSVQATVKPLIHNGIALVDQANAYSLFATGDGAIRLNDQGVNKITLVGDLGTGEWGSTNQVAVDLSNSKSYFQGTAKAKEGDIFLTLADGAVWRPQGDGDIEAAFGTSGGHLNLKSDGVVDLAWWHNQNSSLNPSNQFRTLTIDHATLEEGGIFRVNSDVLHGKADRINIVDASGGGTQYIQVAYDPSMVGSGGVLTALPGDEPIVLDIQGGTALDQVIGKTYQADSPLYQYEIDPTIVANGNQFLIGSLRYIRTENLSETAYTIVDAQAAFRNLWKLEGNNVMRRMGDLRLLPEEVSSGAWARVYGGKLISDSSYGRTFDQEYTGMQAGYDRERVLQKGKLYTGVMLNYLDSNPSYRSGSGKLYSKGLGVYGSWIGNNNHHVDIVFRGSKLNNEYHLTDNSGQGVSGKYDAWAYGVSAEYGYRAQLKNQWFAEPQVELSLGQIGSADHQTDSGLMVHQSSINTAQSRVGLLVGKDFGSENKKGNAYLRSSWVHDFSSNGKLDGYFQGDKARFKTADHQGSHLEINLGANLKLNKKLDTYVELTKSFGGKVDTDWQVNGGIRLMW